MSTPTRSRPPRGEELELAVEDLVFGGAGIARLDGYVVMVSGGMPGDRVRAQVTRSKRDYAEARALEVLEPGPDRIPARAPHPGASWQVLRYERQLEVKHAQVADALRRGGGFDGFQVEPAVPAVEQWRYRNKLEYSFGEGEGGRLVCGFHAPGSFARIDHVDDDVLASEAVNVLRRQIVEWCHGEGLTAYDRRTRRGFLRNLVIREGRHTGQLQARLVTSPGELRTEALAQSVDCHGLLWTRTDGLGETTAGGETELLAGADRIEDQIAGLRYSISPQAFFQTNTEMAERLYAVVVELAGLTGSERVYDLYSGIGTIGLTLARDAGELWGVEVVEEAVADAIANAERNGIANARFFAGNVRLAMRELVEKAGRPDLLVIDPPRAGISKKIVRRILEAEPGRIVYVSCNPSTLAPNAAWLAEGGYELRRVRPVDMFPQTPHIECVALLERASR